MFVRDKFESEYERVFGVHQYGSTVWSPLLSGILTGKYNDSVEVEGRFKTLSDDMAVKNIFNRNFGSP
jgi:aryl-alcohol dehydrogenase-like predicted oxidoreductase